MAIGQEEAATAIERRYGSAAAKEWDLILRLVDFAEGFALIVLIVPDRDGAELCRAELLRHLAPGGKPIRRLEPTGPEELRRIALPLLETPGESDTGVRLA